MLYMLLVPVWFLDVVDRTVLGKGVWWTKASHDLAPVVSLLFFTDPSHQRAAGPF